MWKVYDKWKNQIVLSKERWQHIIKHHWELRGRLEQVLKTVSLGNRKQDKLNPQKFRYFLQVNDLPHNYTHIVVIVKLAINNFIITAYPISRKER